MAEDANQEDEPVKDEGAGEGAGETAVEEKEGVVDEKGSAETAGEESGEPASLEDRKSTRLNSSHSQQSRMPSSA